MKWAVRSLDKVLWRLLLPGFILPLSILTCLAVGIGAYLSEHSLQTEQQKLLSSQVHTITDYLEQAGRALKALRVITDGASHNMAAQYMGSIQREFNYFDTLYQLSPEGIIEVVFPEDARYENLDMSRQPYFQVRGHYDQPYISPPFRSLRTGQPTVYITLPLADGGQIVGELSLSALQDVIQSVSGATNNDYIFITDHNGNVLAHPDKALVAQRANLGSLPVVREGMTQAINRVYRAEGSVFVASARPIGNTGWVIVAQRPFTAAYGPYITIGAAILIAAGILYWLLVWGMNRQFIAYLVAPLARLTAGARALAQGEFVRGEHLISMSVGINEIETLSSSFHHMSQSLQARERAIKENEERLQSILENMPVMMVAMDTEWNIIAWNRECEHVTGYTSQEIVNNPYGSELLYPDPAYRQHLRKEWQQRGNWYRDWEWQVCCRNGDIKVIAWSNISDRYGVSGWPTWGIGVDVTKRKEAESNLRRLKEFNEKIVQNVAEGILIQNREGIITFGNPAMTTLVDYPLSELAGRDWRTIIPEHLEPIVTAADKRRHRGESDRYELQVLRRTGEYVPVLVSGSPWYEDGEFAGMIAVFTDIRERVEHEQGQQQMLEIAAALRMGSSMEQLLPDLLEKIVSAVNVTYATIVLTDEHLGNEIACYRYPPTLTGAANGYGGIEVVTFPLQVQYQSIGMLEVGSQQQRPFTGDERRQLQAIAEMSATAIHRILLYNQSLQHAAELETRVAKRTHELAEANTRLQELDRLKSKFVSDVSHELRTPITNLVLYLDLLSRGNPEKKSQYQEILHHEARRLGDLVENILDLSRLHTDHTKTQPQAIDLNQIITQVVSSEVMHAQTKALSLTFTPQTDLPPVLGITSQLFQVISNLITNAINYTHEGSVEIRSYQLPDQPAVCLEVCDTGIGIAPEDKPHLFDRFYRGQQVASMSHTPGSGLGLAIVKEIVDLHQGTIEVTSGLNKGSIFRVYLPASHL